MKKINVLVSGAGNGVGQSIIRSLRLSKLKLNIFTCDINSSYAKIYNPKKYIVFPKVETFNSHKKILKIFKKYNIDVFFCGSEFEIYFFSNKKGFFEKNFKTKICITNKNTIRISNDKYLTYKFLKVNGLPFPKTSKINKKTLSREISKYRFPVILKDRFGTSSRNVYLVKNINELKVFLPLIKKPIIQEYLKHYSKNNSSLNEYTCSFFSNLKGKRLGIFVLSRQLKNGTSWITEHNLNYPKKLVRIIEKISEKIENIGSFNIQLIKTKKNYIPFEFNSRFSGTTSVRAHFGFNEPEMFIKDLFKEKLKVNNLKITEGKVVRYIEEIKI